MPAGRRFTTRQFASGEASGSRGGRKGFLERWRKKDNLKQSKQGRYATIDVFLATATPVTKVYQHQWPRYIEPRGQRTQPEWWSGDWNCLEDFEVVEGQYFRDEEGRRERPPQRCPICRMSEVVRGMVYAGELGLMDPVFQFGEGEKAITYYAGAIYGGFTHGFRSKDEEERFTKEEVEKLAEIGVYESNAWQGDLMAKRKFVFVVVDPNHVDDGLKVVGETAGLGGEVEQLLANRQKLKGEERGDAYLHPFCISWFYYPDAPNPGDRYQAMVNDEVEPTERIVELVRSGKVPEQYEQVLSYGNVKTLRAEMEKHALVALPWDDIFGPAEAICDEAGFPQLEDDPEAPEVDRPAPVVEGVETLPCDTCKKEISATATTCPHCGTEYEVEQTPDVQGQPEPGFAGDDIPFS